MNYEMEELVPIVADLAKKCTGIDSSSITYEKANQLMEAVQYCIRETERHASKADVKLVNQSAREAYELGVRLVKQKVEAALKLYHTILPEFDSYGNYYLDQTIHKGMPEFFRWYDVVYEPQNTLLTLDYPILRDLSSLEGIDAVYQYLQCIELEQQFLGKINRKQVLRWLQEYHPDYKDMPENLCYPVRKRLLENISRWEQQKTKDVKQKEKTTAEQEDWKKKEQIAEWIRQFTVCYGQENQEFDATL
ncbi:MAG: DUF6179 domain-containing protein [Lachnospiraceae bacterium]|nr:DUF6179 domain-containing protein [Lachnospiraceae bacterium]